jgi:hypothetical protein
MLRTFFKSINHQFQFSNKLLHLMDILDESFEKKCSLAFNYTCSTECGHSKACNTLITAVAPQAETPI